MSRERIMIVEDEESIQELIRYNLLREGFLVPVCCENGESALENAVTYKPDLILLDLMLPGMDGLTVCRNLKNDPVTRRIPVIMLTAKSEESDIVIGLELGADDYITKPFSPKILTARIHAVLRRIAALAETPADEKELVRGPLHMNAVRRSASLDGRELDLTCSEFNILYHLAKRPGWVFTRSQIVNAVRGDDYPVTERAVDVQIVGLRRKMGGFGELIETVRGIGYRFSQEP